MRTVSHFPRSSTGTGAGFTLVELLVSMSILSILLLLLTQLLDQVQRTWKYSESRVSQFREAGVAFDVITKNLAQASLHNYFEVPVDPKTNRPKGSNFQRISDLHFLTVRGQDLGTPPMAPSPPRRFLSSAFGVFRWDAKSEQSFQCPGLLCGVRQR